MVTHKLDQNTQPMELRDYILYSCIGKACNGFANVYLSRKRNGENSVVVRVCPLDRVDIKLPLLEHEIKTLRQLKHQNVLPCLESFVVENILCFVSPLLDLGSVTDLIHTRFLFGIPEAAIVTILHDVIKAVQYIHSKDYLHRGIRCSHILISSDNRVCLTGFRQATSVLLNGKRKRTLHEFTPDFKLNLLWLAPEVLQQNLAGYGSKSDIYSVGISACEMANGFPPFSDMAHMQMLLEKLRGTTPRLLDATTLPDHTAGDNQGGIFVEQKDRKFTQHFHNFTESCLKTNPLERPSANDLLNHTFFKHVKKHRQIFRDLLQPTKPLTISQGTHSETIPFTEKFLSPESNAVSSPSELIEWTF